MESYAIVFSSNTGNTEFLAKSLKEFLPKDSCIYYGKPNQEAYRAKRLYIGFWTDKGTADELILSFLEKVRDTEIFLFGTAGFGGSSKYFEQVLKNVQRSIENSNKLVGTFMCQGKMPVCVRERYCIMKKENPDQKDVDCLIANFDQALSHPNSRDKTQFIECIKASL